MRRLLKRLDIWWKIRAERRVRGKQLGAIKVSGDSVSSAINVETFRTNGMLPSEWIDSQASYQSKYLDLEEKYNKLLAEYTNKKLDLLATAQTLKIQPGDLVIFQNNCPEHMAPDMNSFGVGMVALRTLQNDIGKLVGGPVMVMAGWHVPLDIEVLSRNSQLELLDRLSRKLRR